MKACCEAYLNEQFGGDKDVIGEIYGEYVSSVGEKLKDADNALATAAWLPLDRIAHTIKGNALAVGDEKMAQTAIDLRGAAQLQDQAQAAALVAQMKELATTL